MIRTAALQKTYRTSEIETVALDGIDLQIGSGEFVSIMGPSGCGKSTLLNLLGLLDVPSCGSLSFLGEEVSRLSERRRAHLRKGSIGFIFQSFNLIDALTVEENVELPLVYLRRKPRERARRVREVLERTQIDHRQRHYPRQLSGGQQQRVSIARAIISDPVLILADEPTGNLDSRNGLEIMNLLSELHRAGTTIVMVTHSANDAGFSERTVRLRDGRIVNADLFLDSLPTSRPTAGRAERRAQP